MHESDTASPPLTIFLLGQPQLILNDQPIQDQLLGKALALFCYLAMDPRPHPRAALATLLWSDMPDQNARMNLRTTINRLRKQLGDYLEVTRQTVAFDQSMAHWLDVAEFEAGLDSDDPERMRAALALYRQDFLNAFFVRGADLFEEWQLVERERLRQQATDGWQRLGQRMERAGNRAQAIADYRQVLQLDAWRESTHRGLMRLYVQNGDRPAALAHYEQYTDLLQRELGVEPAAETVALYEQIRDETAVFPLNPLPKAETTTAVSAPPRHNLPAIATSFHGRQNELTQCLTLLRQPDCRLLTLTGLGGVGKSRLALEIGWQLIQQSAEQFTDGVFWIPLTAVQGVNGIISQIAETVGIFLSGRSPLQEQLFTYLAHKKHLFIVDNCEHLMREITLLSDLLRAAPGVKLLATSRERLKLYEEWATTLEGLPYPPNGSLEIGEYEAVQLFVQRARRTNLAFDWQKEAQGVKRICQLVEGMPLGIELAASWTGAFAPLDIAQQIERLSQELYNLPQRHHSLQATFEYSWRLLTAEERGVLSQTAVFHGGFDLQALTALTRAPARALANLVEKSLVRRLDNGRYALHEQIRQFAAKKASKKQRLRTRQRHAAYYAALAHRLRHDIQSHHQEASIQLIRQDLDNVHLAWQTAVEERQLDWLDQMLDVLARFYQKQGLFHEGEQRFRETAVWLENSQLADGAPEWHHFLGRLLVYQGRCGEYISSDLNSVAAVLERGLHICEQYEDHEAMAYALIGLGFAALSQGQYALVEERMERCRQLSEAHHLPLSLAGALNYLGWVRFVQQRVDEAKSLTQQAIAIFQELDDSLGIASALNTLGIINNRLGAYEQAEAAYRESLERCRQRGHRVGEAQALTGLFGAAYYQGKLVEAAVYAEQSLHVNQDVGNQLGMGIARHNLGFLAAEQGDRQTAVSHYRQALTIYAELGSDVRRMNNSRRHLADNLMALRRMAEAKRPLAAALSDLPDQPDRLAGEVLLSALRWLVEEGQQMKTAVWGLSWLVAAEPVSEATRNEAATLLETVNEASERPLATYADLLKSLRTAFR